MQERTLTQLKRRSEGVVVGIVLIYLIVFNTTRTVTLSITYDEAATYLWHINYSIWKIISFSTSGLPDNNHVLLTLLAKLSIYLFGDTSFSLRLPSSIGYALYCITTLAILRRFVDGPLLVLLLVLITCNPMLLDLMATARGYGLGITLTMVGTWALLQASSDRKKTLWVWIATISFALAAVAHLSLALFFPIFMVLLGAELLAGCMSKRVSWREAGLAALAPILVGLPLAWFLGHQIAVLKPLGLLATEGLNSFYADTIKTTVAGSLFDGYALHDGIDLICILICAVLLCSIITIAAPQIVTDLDRTRRHDLLLLIGLMLGVSLSSYLQHVLFDVAFLSGRRAMSLFPIYVLCLAATIALLINTGTGLRRATAYTLIGASLVVSLQFVRSTTLRRTMDWGFDADVDTMVGDLGAVASCVGIRPIILGADWYFDTAINYYIQRDHITRIAPVSMLSHDPLIERLDQTDPQGQSDLYYLFKTDLSRLEHARGLQAVVRSYANSGTVLTVPASSVLSSCARTKTDVSAAAATPGGL